jgi:geranylgeranyl pyrophosphate synthase
MAPPPLDAMTRFGFYLGAAFQIRDDLLDLVGSEVRYTKELLAHLREASGPSCSSTCWPAPPRRAAYMLERSAYPSMFDMTCLTRV